MKIGIFAAIITPLATPERILDLGRHAENTGLDSLWLGEHVALFDEMEYPCPHTPDGKVPIPEGCGILDPVVTLSYLAAVTSNLRLGTGVALLPQRSPVYTAKEFATLDYLTGGRIDLGFGVGWCKEEVEACGYSFENRGERCDEMLELIQMLWSQPVTDFNGKHYQVKKCHMDPKPLQQPMPLFVGGFSKAAIKRAIRVGSGWLGFGLDPASAEPLMQMIDALLAAAGRHRDDFEIIISPVNADADSVRAFRDLGVDRLLPIFDACHPDGIDHQFRVIEEIQNAAA